MLLLANNYKIRHKNCQTNNIRDVTSAQTSRVRFCGLFGLRFVESVEPFFGTKDSTALKYRSTKKPTNERNFYVTVALRHHFVCHAQTLQHWAQCQLVEKCIHRFMQEIALVYNINMTLAFIASERTAILHCNNLLAFYFALTSFCGRGKGGQGFVGSALAL